MLVSCYLEEEENEKNKEKGNMAIQDDSHAFYTCNVFAYEQ